MALHALVPDVSISFTSSSGVSGFSGTFQHGTDARGSFSFFEIVSKEELVEVLFCLRSVVWMFLWYQRH